MGRQFGGLVDPAAIGMVHADAARVQVHLAADPAGQERRRAAIFAVTDNGMADRRHMHAQLMGAPRKGLQLDPAAAVPRPFDHAVARACRLAVFLVDMHLLATGAGLLGDGQLDRAVVDRGHADDQRPVDLLGGAPRKGLGEERRRAGVARDQQRARRVLVQPVDQFGPPLRLELQCIEQAVDMGGRLGPALRRQTWRLVQDQRVAILVDHHFARERFLVLGQDVARAHRRLAALGRRGFGGRHAQHLARRDPVARCGAQAVDAQLAGARPFGDRGEAGVGHMPLEPTVQPDTVIVIADRELADRVRHAKILVIESPAQSAASEPSNDKAI